MKTAAPIYPTSIRGQLRRHAGAYLLGTFLLLVQQSLMLGRDRLFKTGVDAATAEQTGVAVNAAALAIGAVVIAATVRVLSRVVMFNGGRAAEYELRAALLARLHTLGPSFFRKIPTGDILSRATNDLGQVRLLLGFGVLNIVNTIFALVSALTLMLGVSVRLTLATLTVAPVLMLTTRWFSRNVFLRTKENQEALGKMSERVQASLAGVRVVRSLSLEDAEISAFEKTSEAYLVKSLKLAQLRGAMFPIMGSVSAIGILVVFWYGGTLVLENQITRGDFVAFWAALERLVWPLLALGFVMSMVQRGRASHQRLTQIYDAVPEVVDGTIAPPAQLSGALAVKGLTYAIGGRNVLDEVTFEVAAGSSLAIVGRTGSGKSTLAAMLPRLLPTPAGTVFLDGIDVCSLPLTAARGAIGYAQQDAFLFSTTVARNVGFSLDDPEAPRSHERILAAAEEAQIKDEIEDLPEGFDTVVGERGVQLSGGQRQRVALARAFLWEPRVLVLDDPLSAVDAKTEAKILAAIDRQAKKRTLLLVTHRIAAAARCDRVVVLDQGKIVEAGTSAELLARGGIYAAMALEQKREGELSALSGDAPPVAEVAQ